MMVNAIMKAVPGEYFYHKLTVCHSYDALGLKGSWMPWGYDIALDLGGDTFTTYYGFRQFLRHCVHLFKLWVCGQRYAVFSQTLSPYRGVSRVIARFFLNRATFITVRERKSYDLLKVLGIRTPFYLASDIAFLLDDCSSAFYYGSSYHLLINAYLAYQWYGYDESRNDNWKFSILERGSFKYSRERFKEMAQINVRVLQRSLYA